jgi:hypothetical protein
MSEIMKEFAEIQRNYVEHRHEGGWPVYADYDLVEHEREGNRQIYVVRSNLDLLQTWWYAPLRVPVLFIEFAELFDRPTASEEAAPTVLDWVKRYGTLGAGQAYSNVDGRYSAIDWTFSCRLWPHPYDIQSVDEFVMLSVRANRCWRLLKAAKARGGPDAEKLRELLRGLNAEDDTPARLADLARTIVDHYLNIHLRKETCMERYPLGHGKSVRGPGFLSLLGALYLQMSNFQDAEEITYCKWCGEVVDFEQEEDPPNDAPKGTRGKHKTHSNREYCKEKYGKKDYCKNQFNYQRRKKAKEGF